MLRSPAITARSNTRLWCFFILAGFAVIALQAFNLHIVHHRLLKAKSDGTILRKWVVQAQRGAIRDRTGEPLAYSVQAGSVFADPKLVTDPRAAAAALAPVLEMPAGELEPLLRKRYRVVRTGNSAQVKRVRFVWLKRRVDEVALERVRKLALPGIGIQPEPKRVWPYGSLAAHTLGFVNDENRGAVGLERSLDRVLAGTDGKIVAEVDAGNRLIPGRKLYEEPALPGRDLILTIDRTMQQAAEAALADALHRWQALGGCVIVADPTSGEILALATLPSFDPACPSRYPPQSWRHPAVSCVYEPGSTFKLVTAYSALEENAVRPGEIVVHCAGSTVIGNHTIRCAVHGRGGHGSLDLEGVIVHSCNIGIGKVAERIPSWKIARYMSLLGFGSRTGIELPGEARGWFPDPSRWSKVQKANIAFGQSVAITPLQLLAAYCAVGNCGTLPHLHLVRRIAASADDPGKEVRLPGRPVMSPATAEKLRTMFTHVVERGTGKAAAIAGYRIAGKTGTAQKPTPELGYNSGKYIGSFVGFLPADNPKVAVLVVIDEPKGSHYGAVVAAPAFRVVASRAASHLGIAPIAQVKPGVNRPRGT